MKIRAVRNTFASGKLVEDGTILEVPSDISEADAKRLILVRKAVIVPPSDAGAASAGVEVVDNDNDKDKSAADPAKASDKSKDKGKLTGKGKGK